MKKIKIGVIGTHSTGKSAFIKVLKNEIEIKGFNVKTITELARDCPYPVNELSTLKSQKWILEKQIEEENLNNNSDFIITDRCVLDNYAYLLYNNNSKDDKESLKKVLDQIKSYDFLILKKINRDYIRDDGFRSLDKKFQLDIQEKILHLLKKYSDLFDSNNIVIKQLVDESEVSEFVKDYLKL